MEILDVYAGDSSFVSEDSPKYFMIGADLNLDCDIQLIATVGVWVFSENCKYLSPLKTLPVWIPTEAPQKKIQDGNLKEN